MWLKLDRDALSTKKTNIIPVTLPDHGIIGNVSRIVSEDAPGQYKCEVNVYPSKVDIVLSSMNKEKNKLEGR